jgi:hypothetical protein
LIVAPGRLFHVLGSDMRQSGSLAGVRDDSQASRSLTWSILTRSILTRSILTRSILTRSILTCLILDPLDPDLLDPDLLDHGLPNLDLLNDLLNLETLI